MQISIDVGSAATGTGGDVVFWLDRTLKAERLLKEVLPEQITAVSFWVPGSDVAMMSLHRDGTVFVEGIAVARNPAVFVAFAKYLAQAGVATERNAGIEEGDGTSGNVRFESGRGSDGAEHGAIRFDIDGRPLSALVFMGRGVAMAGSALLTGRRVFEAFVGWMLDGGLMKHPPEA